ncbi:MAG: acyl-CoA dehydrogenase family protein [Pseudorhodoplanes sp.]|uniref:acyl-CoA dehydrogenase family protein n=1 Tax=Pseudorhodoplanes sp. TaxID=1934341 RepID=UPI003D136D77
MALAAATAPTETTPDVPDLLARAGRIGAIARERATEFEKARQVSADLVEQMREQQLFRIMQPKRFGGFELGYDVFVEAVCAVASGDGSTGWVYSLGAVHPWMIGCYPDEAQHDFWRDSLDAVAAVSYAPAGKATAERGGYRLSGRWSFASGVDNATWGIVGGIIPLADGPKPGFFLVPKSDYTIHDDWNTMGLAATGSKTIVVDNAFVPAHRLVTFAEMLTGQGPGIAVNLNPIYRQPMLAVVPHCLVSPALGMARGALKAFIEQVGNRTTRGAVAGGNNRMSEFATVQLRVAEATASIDAAQLMIHRDLRETSDAVHAGRAVDLDMRLRNRLTHTFATRLCVQAVDAVFVAMGGSALGMQHPVQRFWRDIHAASSHISLNWDAVGAMYGQHVFGLEPKGQY